MFSQRKFTSLSTTKDLADLRQVYKFISLSLICFFAIDLRLTTIDCIYAQEFELDRIVVTAKKGQERDIQSIPANITVITSKDIARSNARTMADLLKSEAGLVVRDILGNGGQASVDIRGFGAAAAMNCAILVDGRRVSNIDMANPDLTQVSLAQIDRIEVLRGGASVLYGDGAMGGVINIITKKAEKKKMNLSASFNAFNGADVKFGIVNVMEKISYSVNGSQKFNGGYREHSEMDASDIGIRIGQEESRLIPGWDLDGSFHRDNYQLPGSIEQTDWDSGYYWKSYAPNDKGEAIDWHSKLAIKKSIGKINTETEISLRNRNAKTFWEKYKMYNRKYMRILGAGEKISFSLFGVDILGGIEYYSNSYDISPDSRTGEPTPRNDDQRLQRYSTGAYLQATIPVLEMIFLEVGGRIEKFDQYFIVEITSIDTFKPEVLDALYAGLSLKILEGTNVYARWAKSFRLPKTDEYLGSTLQTTNLFLKPQKSEDIEWGVKYASEKIGATLSLFLMRIQDEIYYNKVTLLNENYPNPTIRMGGELQIKANIFDFVSISLGYTLTDARFETGAYADKEVPLVPRHKGNIELALNLPFETKFAANCIIVSDRWFGTDFGQTADKRKLSGYTVADLKLSRKFGDLNLFAAVDNIGDVRYAESGSWSSWTGKYTYYPSPVRNFILGMDVNL